jgi:MFS family permease
MDLGRVLVLVFLGGAIALGLMMVWKVLLPQPTMDLGLSIFMAGNLLFLLPAGWIAVRVGNVRCLFWALVSAIVLVLILTFPALWPTAWFGLGIAIAFVMNAALPIAIAQSTANRTGVAVGAYFGGVAIAGAVVNFLMLAIGPLSPDVASGLAVVAFTGAIGCVWRLYPKPWRFGV